jgi:hypothetical protein
MEEFENTEELLSETLIVDDEKYTEVSDITIFDPRNIRKGYTYVKEYPEMSRIIEFQNIQNLDLIFIWWYSNPTSPLVLNFQIPVIRASKAYYKTFGRNHTDGKKKLNFCRAVFPEGIKMAIEKMVTFDVDARGRAKIMINKIFTDYEKIINTIELSEFKTAQGEIDYNKYVGVRKMIVAEIYDLIRIKEEGFGIKAKNKKEKDEEEGGQRLISSFLKEKKDE